MLRMAFPFPLPMRTLTDYAPALLAALLWSTAASAFKLALADASVTSVLFFSVVTGATTLLALCAITATPLVGRTSGPNGPRLLFHAALNPLAYYLLLFAAYDRLPAQVALCANYTWAPLLTLLAVPLLGQSLRPATLVALALAYAGLMLVVLGQSHVAAGDMGGVSVTGVALALASAMIWALDWCLAAATPGAGLAFLARKFTLACPPLALVWWIDGAELPAVPAWPAILWIGWFELSVTFWIWLAALRRAPSTATAATLVQLSPALSLIWIALVVGEPIRPPVLVGLAMIITAAMLGTRRAPERA